MEQMFGESKISLNNCSIEYAFRSNIRPPRTTADNDDKKRG